MAKGYCKEIKIVFFLNTGNFMLSDFENEINKLKARIYETWGRL